MFALREFVRLLHSKLLKLGCVWRFLLGDAINSSLPSAIENHRFLRVVALVVCVERFVYRSIASFSFLWSLRSRLWL